MELAVETRELLGKKVVSLRREGKIPAELYGHGVKNQHLTVDAKAFRKALKEAGESTVLTLVLGKQKFQTLIHDIQRDAISEAVTHVDFYEVRMDEKVTTEVPIVFAGDAPAVKAYGGVLVKSLEKIEVEALPADLPQNISVDLSVLGELNQTIYVRDIPIIERVKFLADPEMAVASVTEQQIEVEEIAPPASEIPTEGEVASAAAEGEQIPAEGDKKESKVKPYSPSRLNLGYKCAILSLYIPDDEIC